MFKQIHYLDQVYRNSRSNLLQISWRKYSDLHTNIPLKFNFALIKKKKKRKRSKKYNLSPSSHTFLREELLEDRGKLKEHGVNEALNWCASRRLRWRRALRTHVRFSRGSPRQPRSARRVASRRPLSRPLSFRRVASCQRSTLSPAHARSNRANPKSPRINGDQVEIFPAQLRDLQSLINPRFFDSVAIIASFHHCL